MKAFKKDILIIEKTISSFLSTNYLFQKNIIFAN